MISCVYVADVDIAALAEWISAIPFEAWPQQNRLADRRLRPAMVTDLGWHGFGKRTEPVVSWLLTKVGASQSTNRMLSVVMPGHAIDPHRDGHAAGWSRLHVPLVSNALATFVIDGAQHVLEPGKAYRIDTMAEHAVRNDGATPRIHLMFDVV